MRLDQFSLRLGVSDYKYIIYIHTSTVYVYKYACPRGCRSVWMCVGVGVGVVGVGGSVCVYRCRQSDLVIPRFFNPYPSQSEHTSW